MKKTSFLIIVASIMTLIVLMPPSNKVWQNKWEMLLQSGGIEKGVSAEEDPENKTNLYYIKERFEGIDDKMM